MGMRSVREVLVGKPEGKDHSKGLGVGDNIILEWIIEK
jgi:hypothetical protein